MIVLYAIIAAIAAFALILFGGRDEPTTHGQIVIMEFAFVAAFVVFFAVLGGYGLWAAFEWWTA